MSLAARLAVALALALATVGLFGLVERFEPAGPELLRADAWRVSPGGGAAERHGAAAKLTAAAGQRPTLSQLVLAPDGAGYLRLEGELRWAGVAAGERPWERARLLLVQLDEKGRARFELPHTVLQAEGDANWRAVARTFWISQRTGAVEARLQLNRVAGELEARGLALTPMRERDGFAVVRQALLLGSLLAWAWAALPVLAWRLRGVVAVGLGVLIVAGALLPHSAKQEAQDFVGELLAGPRPAAAPSGEPARAPAGLEAPGEAEAEVDWLTAQKIAHFAAFVLLALAAFWAQPATPAWRIVVWLAGFAAASEAMQLFAVDRTPQVRDAALNIAGVLAGAALAAALRYRGSGTDRAPSPPSTSRRS